MYIITISLEVSLGLRFHMILKPKNFEFSKKYLNAQSGLNKLS